VCDAPVLAAGCVAQNKDAGEPFQGFVRGTYLYMVTFYSIEYLLCDI